MSKKKVLKLPPNSVARKLTPSIRDAVAGGWAPIDIDPIDLFTPEFYLGMPKDQRPVFKIRKASEADSLRALVDNPSKAIRKGPNAVDSPEFMAVFAEAMLDNCRTYLVGWENWRAGNGELVEFKADKSGHISEESLRLLGRAFQTMIAIHFRITSHFKLTPVEKEGFGSTLAST